MASSTLYDYAVQSFLNGDYDFFDESAPFSYTKDINYWIVSRDGEKICFWPRPAKDIACQLIREQPFF